MCRLLESFCNDDAQMLPDPVDIVILQWHPRFARRAIFRQVIGIRFESGCIFPCKNADDTRRGFRSRKVDAYDAAIRNRALNEHAAREVRSLKFRCVSRRASDFESAIETRKWLTNKCRAHDVISAIVFKARTMLRLANSILYELYLYS